MPQLSDFLTQLFSGMSVNEVSEMTGIAPSVMSRLLRGKSSPSPENMLRIAFATGTEPAHLFELAGHKSLAFLCREMKWEKADQPISERDLYGAREQEFHRRLQRLLELGFARQVDGALQPLEQAWELLRPAFESVARDAGAKAAALIADSRASTGDVLFTWKCPEPWALELVKKGKLEGWQLFSHRSESVTIRLFLRAAENANKKHIKIVLDLWSATFSRLYSSGSTSS